MVSIQQMLVIIIMSCHQGERSSQDGFMEGKETNPDSKATSSKEGKDSSLESDSPHMKSLERWPA